MMNTQTLQIKQVPASNAWGWIMSGFELFKTYPVMWIVLLLIYLAIMIPISMLPFIGSVASTLLAPVFAAGMMWGCQAISRHQELEINHLFQGFKQNTSQLITLGAIYMASLLVITIFVVLMLDKETIDLLVQGKDLNPAQARGIVLPILIALLFALPILMAYWFAPVLTGLHNLSAIESMKLSFEACLKNFIPFLLYGLIFMILLIIAIIPFGLGLLIAAPVMMTSLYTSYADIFSIKE
ncbi:MAG: hypothetical protein HOP21_06375 [Methylotenera sp.]|nr:hypothetical protein [Methylotenera sp.]